MMQQLDLFPKPIMPKEGGQHIMILRYLRDGGKLTTLQALQMFGVMALSQRIGDLKKMGWPIKSQTIKTETGKHVAQYSL